MKRIARRNAVVAAVAAGLAGGIAPSIAAAQSTTPAPAEGTAPAQPAVPAPAVAPAAPSAPAPGQSQSMGVFGGYGNPQSSNGTIGGGNATESSSHPVTGDEEDSFDFGSKSQGGGVAHGSENGPIFTAKSGRLSYGGEMPDSHTVRHGDTLWGLSDTYFRNPYEWPRLWSYNAQIRNPNWIYPGDEVRLKASGEATGPAGGPAGPKGTGAGMTLVDRRRQVPNDTVFLRDQGWVRDNSEDIWGEITGSSSDTMFLSNLNQVYMTLKKGRDVKVGQELTIFHTRTTAASGDIVQILGTVRVNQYDPDQHVARGQIVESLDIIERGARVGPLTRSFSVVPPRRNDAEVAVHVLASVHPNEFFGQNQIVFIDKGEASGLQPGNRLFVLRHGDAWRSTLVSSDSGLRISADDERPMPDIEQTPGSKKDDGRYPEEVIAELRVLAVKKDSGVCLVTQSRSEIEIHDVAVARKGY
ncbi:MAG TPA: LysM peptidoglycan-binding domain-containing protein [Polyangiaceae bacterium]|jgi:hypothetical protein|nr:LysM peptidoglycan-binding domain-containing protein [Polyangiaceae bacterium]